jgi:large subunit ribosomal protein L19
MNQTLIKSVEQSSLKEVQDLRTGYTVKVHQKIKEGDKERIQIFEGLIIAVSGEAGPNRTITVRKVVSGVGVEKIFPVHSSTIEKIEITKIAKIRRAKLYYMRDRSGKSARLKETHINAEHEVNKTVPVLNANEEETNEPIKNEELDKEVAKEESQDTPKDNNSTETETTAKE